MSEDRNPEQGMGAAAGELGALDLYAPWFHGTVEVRQGNDPWMALTVPVFPDYRADGRLINQPWDWACSVLYALLTGTPLEQWAIPSLLRPRAWPDDASLEAREGIAAYGCYGAELSPEWGAAGFCHAALPLADVLAVDYDRAWLVPDGSCISLRQLLGQSFFEHLDILAAFAEQYEVRLLYCFVSS